MASKTVKRESANGRKKAEGGRSLNGSTVYKNSSSGKFTSGRKSEMTEEQRAERRKRAALATFAAAYEGHNKKR